MSERSLKAYDAWRDEAQRFDYFILGLIGAVTAYVVQNLKPEQMHWYFVTAEVVGLSLLIAAAFLGFRRVEHNVVLLRQTHTRLEWEENLSALVENYRGNALRTNLGDVLTPQEVEDRAKQLRTAIEKMGKLQEESAEASGKNYRSRNWCLLLGFSLIAISKFALAYS